jgi:hypothetical protein
MLSKSVIKSASCRTSNHLFIWVVAVVMLLQAMASFGQNVHQLSYNNSSWADTNLTAVAGGAGAQFIGVTAFSTSPNNDLHVFYIASSDSHIHQLTYKADLFGLWVWADEDVTVEADGMVASTSYQAPLSGFAIGNAQYVYFCGNDLRMHEYSYGDGGNWSWVDRNLSTLSGGGTSANCPDSPNYNGLVAFATTNGQRHVFYQQGFGSSAIYQLILKGSSWSVENETQATGGAEGDGTWMAGFAIANAQYVFFEAPNGDIHEYSYGAGGKSAWVDTDVTATSGGVESDTGNSNGVAAMVVPGTTQLEVYYYAGSSDLHQMTFENNKWTDENLSGPAPYLMAQIAAVVTTPNNQLHVYYAGDSGIYQKYYNGSDWSSGKLTGDSPLGGYLAGGTSSFTMGNLQYVYYISQQ